MISLQEVSTATQQFRVTGYANAMWRADESWSPNFEGQTKEDAAYNTETGTTVKDRLAEEEEKAGQQHVLKSVAEGEARFFVTDFDLKCVSPLPEFATHSTASVATAESRTCCHSTQPRCSRADASRRLSPRRRSFTTTRRATATKARYAKSRANSEGSHAHAAQAWAGMIKMCNQFEATLTQRFKMK